MDFQLSEEHQMIRQAARDFAKNECLPGVIERDEHQRFPLEQVKKLASLGFMGMMVDPAYGGAGMDTISYVLAMEEISKVDASTSVCMSVNNSLVCYGLEAYGTEEQKQKYLTHLARGMKDNELYIGAFLLSEPEAGSDATSQQTTAEDKGDHYLLNGTKNWITNGSKENRIGADGFGFTFAMRTLAGGRIGIAAQALGIASGAYELALAYSKQRKAFGKEIMHHQAIQFKLADMATRIEAARLLCLKAAWEKDNNLDYTLSSSMAKVAASETAMWVTTEAVQVHGGYGFVKEYHVERLMRDAKITQIYEGTSEVQRIVIGRSILK